MTMNQDNQGQNDNFASGGDEFVFTEDKKPVNRNLLVLLLIAVVGGGMIYLMYRRAAGSGGVDEATRQKSEQVAAFAQKSEEDLKKLDEMLQKMETNVAQITGDPAASQIPTDRLPRNPFESPKSGSDPTPTKTLPPVPVDDPQALAARAAKKAEVQMISFATRDSSCIINSKLCREGEQVVIDGQSFKVKQIARDHVVLEHELGSFKVGPKAGGL